MFLFNKLSFFAAAFFFFAVTCHSQELIKGNIYSGADSTAIMGASIYFDGTNVGVSTDVDGSFKLWKENGITTPLIISSLGFKTIAVGNDHLGPGKVIKIYLQENTEPLDAVFLETDPWSRKKKLDIFRREFLGNTKAATRCRIKNEDAIDLRYIPSREVLVAYVEEPLVIINRHLGYEVRYNLQNFRVEFSNGESGFRLTHLVYYEGYSFFKEIRRSPSKKHLKNREKAFEGSSLHFMRSLAAKKLRENGFKIFRKSFEVPSYELFQITPSGELTKIELLEEKVNLLYNDFEQSAIAAAGSFYIDQWGNHTPPSNVLFGGVMGSSRVALTLPLNYGTR